MRIPRVVHEFAVVFRTAGFQCYLVGGAVRDILMARGHTDFDIATDARPEQVIGLFRRVLPTGIRHGTVTVLFSGTTFEVTTFRTEADYTDGRHPDSVSYSASIEEDLARRDFTINAMAYDFNERRLLDPHNGQLDISRGIIRAIGDPAERFREDGLRPLRACRIAAQLSFTVDMATRAAIPGALAILARVSAERLRDELLKILAAPLPSIGFLLMKETGILAVILPELLEGVDVMQGDLHCYDVFTHALHACDAAPRESLPLRLAALLHDVGKPRCRGDDGGRPTFYGHETLSARMCEDILTRLKLPNAVVHGVAHLVSHHMFNYNDEWSDAAVRRLIARVGEDRIPDLMALRRADQVGMCSENAAMFPEGLARFAERVAAVQGAARAFTVGQLAVNGKDIMARLGIPPGPRVGTLSNELLQAVLDDPSQNEKEKLLAMAEMIYKERVNPAG